VALWPVVQGSISFIAPRQLHDQSEFVANFHDVTGVDVIMDVVVIMKPFQHFKNVSYDIACSWYISLGYSPTNHTSDDVWNHAAEVFI